MCRSPTTTFCFVIHLFWGVLDKCVPGYYHRRSEDGTIEASTCHLTKSEKLLMEEIPNNHCEMYRTLQITEEFNHLPYQLVQDVFCSHQQYQSVQLTITYSESGVNKNHWQSTQRIKNWGYFHKFSRLVSSSNFLVWKSTSIVGDDIHVHWKMLLWRRSFPH